MFFFSPACQVNIEIKTTMCHFIAFFSPECIRLTTTHLCDTDSFLFKYSFFSSWLPVFLLKSIFFSRWGGKASKIAFRAYYTKRLHSNWCKWVCVVLLTALIMKPKRLIIHIITPVAPSNHLVAEEPRLWLWYTVDLYVKYVGPLRSLVPVRIFESWLKLREQCPSHPPSHPPPHFSLTVIWLWMVQGGAKREREREVIDGYR